MYGYSLNDIAKETGVTYHRLHLIQSGFDTPLMEELFALAKLFNVKPSYFYNPDKLHNKRMVVDSNHISFRFVERD